jgi:hypothetical protein
VPVTTEEPAPSITERVTDAAQHAAQAVKQMAADAKDKVVEGAHYLKEKVTGEETPAEATTGAARDVGRDIKGASADVKESAAAGTERVRDTLPSKEDLRAKKDDFVETASDKLQRAGDKASELAGAAKEKIAEGAHELKRKITGEETTGEAVQGASQDVGHTASRAAYNVRSRWRQARSASRTRCLRSRTSPIQRRISFSEPATRRQRWRAPRRRS